MKNIFIKAFALLAVTTGLTSCSDFFNPDSKRALLEDDYASERAELYGAYFGLGALVADVADQAVFLEGLRGEFLEPTENAPQELWDIYNYDKNLKGNSHADPQGYYNIINNANDYIVHLDNYRKNYPTAISEASYMGLGGGAIRFKVWAYLMLAKIYGEAALLEDPVTHYQDINKFTIMDFDAIIDKCIDWMVNGDKGYVGVNTIRWSQDDYLLLPHATDGNGTHLEWNRVTPLYQPLLAELYLWKGDYQACFDNCLNMIDEGSRESSFMVNLSDYNGEWISMMGQYTRKEHINAAFYSYHDGQTNRIHKYFNNQYPNQYLLRPTEAAMERFNTQVMNGSTLGDKYRGDGKTFAKKDGVYVVNKFASKLTASNIYYNDILISLYRASDIHLFMIEALNNMRRFEEASVFLNGGINSYYNTITGTWIEGSAFDGVGYPTALFNSRGDRSNAGIRGRVDLSPIVELDPLALNSEDDITKYIAKVDSALVAEACLESAGESRGYYAMIRNARKYPEMRKVWAEQVASKYPDGGALIKAELEADIKNWFIKYDLND